MNDAVFAALGDRTRRDLFSSLASAGPSTATSLAADMSISRQAVAKHLGILSDAGMASSRRVGRETRFEANLAPLQDLTGWVKQVEGEWGARLAALATSLE